MWRVAHPKFWLVSFFFQASSLKKAWSWPQGWSTPLMCGVTPRVHLSSLVSFLWASPGRGRQAKTRPPPPTCPKRHEKECPDSFVYKPLFKKWGSMAWCFREWCFSNYVWWTAWGFLFNLLQNKMWAPWAYLACSLYTCDSQAKVDGPELIYTLFTEICPLTMHLDVTAMSNYKRFPLLPFSFCSHLVTDRQWRVHICSWHFSNIYLQQCFSKSGPWTSSISITRELATNTNSQAPFQTSGTIWGWSPQI